MEDIIYIYAVRYALGRRTTAPYVVQAALVKPGVIQACQTFILEKMMKEILASINKGEIEDPAAETNWLTVIDNIESELLKRKVNENKN